MGEVGKTNLTGDRKRACVCSVLLSALCGCRVWYISDFELVSIRLTVN